MKHITKKKAVGLGLGSIVIALIIGFIAVMMLKVDSQEARNIAMEQAGGGEIVAEEISNEGLWNEYSYVIINGDRWYDIEIGGFGGVNEVESGTGDYPRD